MDSEAAAIQGVIERQFRSLTWSEDAAADWASFADTFIPGAWLFPAARPVKPQTVPEAATGPARKERPGSTRLRDLSLTVNTGGVYVPEEGDL